MASGPNLFARLHKWAARQDENFLTESLAVLLEQLLVLAPDVAVRLVGKLTDGLIDVPAEGAGLIEITPHPGTDQGYPDLDIAAPSRLARIEVKVESDLGPDQLARYKESLDAIPDKEKRLILLTRYPTVYSQGDTQPDRETRWFEVADWLERELSALKAAKAAGCVPLFLAQQFLDFVRGRGMSLEKVEYYLPDGLRALGHFLNMLVEAANACNVVPKISKGENHIGVTLAGNKYRMRVFYAEPEMLEFSTRTQVDPKAAAKLDTGEVTPRGAGYRWRRSVNLNSEEVYFFARSKVRQMEWLENFLRECLKMARSIEIPGGPPIPEEAEGD